MCFSYDRKLCSMHLPVTMTKSGRLSASRNMYTTTPRKITSNNEELASFQTISFILSFIAEFYPSRDQKIFNDGRSELTDYA